MAGVVPGQRLGELIAIIGGGLLIFVPLFIYLCVKVGVKPTLGLFTIGLHPKKRQRSRDGSATERASDEVSPNG